MGKVQRQIDPDDERTYWERKVEKAIAIYSKLRNRYSNGRFLTVVLQRKYIHKQPKNYYFKIFRHIIESLEDLRGENTNPYEIMLEDYLTCVHEHYFSRHKRVPYMQQVLPTEFTMSLFQEWITRWEEEHDQPYWISSVWTMEDISQRATESILAAQRAHLAIIDQAHALVTGKTEATPDLILDPVDTKLAKA
jgi:hypothetical protein